MVLDTSGFKMAGPFECSNDTQPCTREHVRDVVYLAPCWQDGCDLTLNQWMNLHFYWAILLLWLVRPPCLLAGVSTFFQCFICWFPFLVSRGHHGRKRSCSIDFLGESKQGEILVACYIYCHYSPFPHEHTLSHHVPSCEVLSLQVYCLHDRCSRCASQS
jgi:hypothetical protein